MLLTTYSLAPYLLPLLVQVGPAPSAPPVSDVPDELYEQRRLNQARREVADTQPVSDPVDRCFARADAEPEAAAREAMERVERSEGIDRAIAQHCRGYALGLQGRWNEAAQAFAAAQMSIPSESAAYRARVAAATGAALLASGDPQTALEQLDAIDTSDPQLTSAVALDRARALVALDRLDEAGTALAVARQAGPDDSETWLLSATLARRQDRLEDAQTFVERAAILRPSGPEIGLEAGVIAVLSGREDTALRSWQSVVDTAPGTPAALTAADYIAQLRGE